MLEIRSSPQWRLGRLTSAHIVLAWSGLCSLIWVVGESCTVVHGITSQSANVFSNVVYWHFLLSLTVWLQFDGELFDPLFGGFVGCRGPRVHISSPLSHLVYLLLFFNYFVVSKSVSIHFPSDKPESSINFLLTFAIFFYIEKKLSILTLGHTQCSSIVEWIEYSS